jgi:hypothetical protein
MNQLPNSLRSGPDAGGHFGAYGGRFVAETLMPLILSLQDAYDAARRDPQFAAELNGLLTHYVGRESPLYFAERLTAHLGGPKIYLKREDLNHTGAHKINNCLGQILLAKRMGKTRIIAETGAGQHGVATATVAARFGLPCTVYMGEVDMAAAPMPRACSIPSWMTAMSPSTAWKRPAMASTHRDMPRPCPRARPACCMARAPIFCRTRTARSSRPIPSPPVSTIRAWDPNIAG